MNHPSQLKRVMLLLGLLGAAFAGLGYRLVDLQVLRHGELSIKSEQNTQHKYWLAPRRGDILDVNGNLLAGSQPVKTICANPAMIGDYGPAVARALAPLLQIDAGELGQRLIPRVVRTQKGALLTNGLTYVRLQKNVTEETWQKIQATMTNLQLVANEKLLDSSNQLFLKNLRKSAVYAEADQMRSYPNGTLACQVLGFSGIQEKNVNGRETSQIYGRDGIERAMNTQLAGVPGWRVAETDRQEREIVEMSDEDVEPCDGATVVLTIDATIQHIVEDALVKAMKDHEPQSVTGIVMRPKTGEILAMASLPNYDPNRPNTVNPEARNRVITDVVEPGSTFKIVVVSGALNNHVVTLNQSFYCEEGHFAYAGRILHDHEPYGYLTTEGIITKSSNIGAAKIGILLGAPVLHDYATNFGFGRLTGIPLPGEQPGILYPAQTWKMISLAQIPMGHGVAVTRLQMLMAMGALANHGWLMRPMIVNHLQNHDGVLVQKFAPQRVHQVVSEETARQMVEALKTVVTKDGTAVGAAMENYVAAGKTGTAQKVINRVYAPGKFISSFIGFFPADNPELVISIVMDDSKEGYYGGKVCGPVFKDIADRCASYLNVPSDQNLRPTNSTALMAAGERLPAPPMKTRAQLELYEFGNNAAGRRTTPHLHTEGAGLIRDTTVESRNLKYVADACGASILSGAPNLLVQNVSTDSRQASKGDVFFAIKGERFDGHDFLNAVSARGAAAVVIREDKVPDKLPTCAVLTVKDVRAALGRLAAVVRQGHTLAVVAVAGSNGKTTTKELIASVLSQKLVTLKSEASFNNDIGVPLTLLKLTDAHQAAVLEVGTNHPGELGPLVRMIQPQFGIITNIGREHLEFFGDLAGVAREEGMLAELLPANGSLFINGDNDWTETILQRTQAVKIRVGLGAKNDWRAKNVRLDKNGVSFRVEAPKADFNGEYRVNLLGRHQAGNALLAVALGAELGLGQAQLQAGLEKCPPQKMRLQYWEANGVRVLNDAYNANADSTLAALQTLCELPLQGRRVAVLGDMNELGDHREAAHREVGRRAAELGVGQLFAVGKMAGFTAAAARQAGLARVIEFADVETAMKAVKSFLKPGDVVLFKASRSCQLERIAETLKLDKN